MSGQIVEFRLDDVVHLRKPHPCGGYDWRIVRLGADLGLKCLKCERRVLLPRSTVERRMKAFVSRGPELPEGVTAAQIAFLKAQNLQ